MARISQKPVRTKTAVNKKKYQTFFQHFYWPIIIPSLITLSAICFGLSAIRAVSVDSDYAIAMLFIAIAAGLDNIDGWAARKLKAVSPIGAQLDSLADFLNFAVSPAFVMYQFSLYELQLYGWAVTLLFIFAGAFRLARFNTTIEDPSSKWKFFFQGVPTPAGAGMCLTPLILYLANSENLTLSPWIIAVWMVITAILMVSSFPTYSSKNLKIKTNSQQAFAVLLLSGFIIAIGKFGWGGLLSVATIYLLSLFISPFHFYAKNKKAK
ncbi:MAG: CDP-alcohol phosphatidyltransferase family protein [Alphaproteobacteria bacterium]